MLQHLSSGLAKTVVSQGVFAISSAEQRRVLAPETLWHGSAPFLHQPVTSTIHVCRKYAVALVRSRDKLWLDIIQLSANA